MSKKAKKKSFLRVTVERVGVRKASDIMTFVMCWTYTHAELGHEPSVEEYAASWKVSASTGWRELRAFREAWPEFSTPSILADHLGVDLDQGEVFPNPAGLAVGGV